MIFTVSVRAGNTDAHRSEYYIKIDNYLNTYYSDAQFCYVTCCSLKSKKPDHKVRLFETGVENIGVEPMTSCMPCKRSSQLS